MNLLDIILLVPLVWLAYRGLRRGLIIELASLAALILGIYASIHFSWFAADLLAEWLNIEPEYMSIVSFIVTFIAVVVLVYSVGKVIEKMVDMVALGFLNKLLGSVFGLIKAVLFMSVILLLISSFDKNESLISPELKQESRLYKPIASVIPMIIPRIDLSDPDSWKIWQEKEDMKLI
jgi:membrane protein required for colicin V production